MAWEHAGGQEGPLPPLNPCPRFLGKCPRKAHDPEKIEDTKKFGEKSRTLKDQQNFFSKYTKNRGRLRKLAKFYLKLNEKSRTFPKISEIFA